MEAVMGKKQDAKAAKKAAKAAAKAAALESPAVDGTASDDGMSEPEDDGGSVEGDNPFST